MGMASQVAASGKYFDNMKPPEFTGELKDFEAWHQRFEWFIGLKSAIFQCALRDWQNLMVGMSLAELGDHVARSTRDVKVGTAFIKMAVELHGYLQQSLQGCGMDRMLMPQARSNGFEVWRLLHERLKPHTAVSALADLR